MEMLQFHPTGLIAGTSVMTGAVLEEGLRGAGARLTNALGERFMERADPVRLERSTRDVVARASYVEILEGRGTPAGGVLLDVSHLGAAEVERRFGEMAARTETRRCRPRHRPVRFRLQPTSTWAASSSIRTAPRPCTASSSPARMQEAPTARTGSAGMASPSRPCSAHAPGLRPRRSCRRGASTCPIRSWSQRRSADGGAAPLSRIDGPAPFALTDGLKEAMWVHCGLVRTRTGLLQARERLAELQEEVVAGRP